MKTPSLNWAQGLLRVWISVTLVWVAIIIAVAVEEPRPPPVSPSVVPDFSKMSDAELKAWKPVHGPWEHYDRDGKRLDRPDDLTFDDLIPQNQYRQKMMHIGLFAVIPPAVLFVLGYLGIWSARGFTRRVP